jgi:chromosome segregation ATPase
METIVYPAVHQDVLEQRIFTLHDQLNEAQQTATIAQIELQCAQAEHAELDAALADTMRTLDALQSQHAVLSQMYHSDRTALALAVTQYETLRRACGELIAAYGNNAVDFHRAVARIGQLICDAPRQ